MSLEKSPQPDGNPHQGKTSTEFVSQKRLIVPKLESDAVGSTRRRCNEASRLHFENEQSGTLRLHRLPRRIPSIRSCRSPSFESQKKRPFGL